MDRETLQLLAGLAHDLRTPLCAIAGHSSLLTMGLHGPLSAAQADTIRRIQANQKQLAELIGDFLKYAEAASGSVPMTLERCAIRPIVEQAVAALHSVSAERRVCFEREGEGASDGARVAALNPELEVAHVDQQATCIVMRTLLDDALAHCERDGVIRVRMDHTKESLHVTVESVGSPVADHDVDLLFIPYVRDASGRSICESRHSLSLSRARALARAMGADVSAVPNDDLRVLRLTVSRCANQHPLVG